MTEVREQFYCFTGPDGWAWCEMFWAGGHATAPTPHRSVADAVKALTVLHPGAIVDELMAGDVADAMRWAS